MKIRCFPHAIPGAGLRSRSNVPHTNQGAGPQIALPQDYRLFSDDLSLGIVDPLGNFTALSPQASESTPYLRTDYLNGNVSEHCESSYLSTSSCYQPLVSGCPAAPAKCAPSVEDHADVPRGTEFGEERDGRCITTQYCGPLFVDATPDLSHVVLRANPISTYALTEGAPPASYYEWSDGQLQLLPMPLATNGEEKGLGAGTLHAISLNGQRVILQSVEQTSDRQLYLRDTNLPSSGDPNAQTSLEIGTGVFDTASADDSRIFFTGYPGGELFEYDLNAEVGHRVSDLSDDRVREVFGASEDGSYVYFTSEGALTPGAAPSYCERPVPGGGEQEGNTCNLYLYHDGMTTLIARAGTIAHEARVSPDGRWLAFMSDKDLTGYDTRDAVSGHLDQEVYLYDADTHRLVCASCDPTGARPVGFFGREGGQAALVGLSPELGGGWVASSVPAWQDFSPVEYQARYLSDGGRLFFDSASALVPQDVNGLDDVYEYEPAGFENAEGEPQCTPSSETFGVRSEGCVSLISSGVSAQPSAFLDASESGSGVFFLTTSKLAPQDKDTAPDVYDAHECTTASPCPPAPAAESPPCVTEASCKASPTPQPSIFGPSASATFSGSGNLAAPPPTLVKPAVKKKVGKCPKSKTRNKQGRCVKKPKKSARKASRERRGR